MILLTISKECDSGISDILKERVPSRFKFKEFLENNLKTDWEEYERKSK
jgi:hypothetical protein